ncbi:MAG TPA: hypothetical protein VIL37_10250 [Natronosporangium sp.]
MTDAHPRQPEAAGAPPGPTAAGDALHSPTVPNPRPAADTEAGLTPGVTVVVRATEDPAELRRCVRSIAAQTIDRDSVELIAIADDEADLDVDAPVRVIRLHQRAGRFGFDLGAAAAGRRFVTFVDGRDTVSPDFLSVLLANATEHTVRATPEHDHAWPYSALIPTRLARSARYRRDVLAAEPARDLEALLFWAALLAEPGVTIRTCPAEAGAAYHRSDRPSIAPAPVTTIDQVEQLLELVAELERLATRTRPPVSQRLHELIDAVADRIGDHLRDRPADRPAVVAALDRRPIFHFPYQRLNRGVERGLVVAYAFPPYADTSGIVMAKRIRLRQQVADVVYNAMDRHRDRDQTTRRIAGPYLADEASIPTPTNFAGWRSMEKFALAGMERIREWTAAKGRYRWLYSRAHFAASHLLAALYKLSEPEVSWTAEFSDPLARGRLGEERGKPVVDGPVLTMLRDGLSRLDLPVPQSTNGFVWCEQIAYALADELVFTNENQLTYMLSYCPDPELAELARKKAVIAPHPTLPAEFYSMVEADYPLDDRVTNIGYFGVFYATRGLDNLLVAITRCDPRIRSKLRIHVFTNDPAPLRQRTTELGITNEVRTSPYLPYLEFLNVATRFDCLLVNDTATRDYLPVNPFLPSKWSDYQGCGAPVWGVVEDGSPLSRQPLQFRSPVGDVDAAVAVLTQLVRTKLEGV